MDRRVEVVNVVGLEELGTEDAGKKKIKLKRQETEEGGGGGCGVFRMDFWISNGKMRSVVDLRLQL